MPDGLRRQARKVVTTKTVWWCKSVAVFVHDFQVLTSVHRALAQLSTRERLAPAKSLSYGDPVIVKVFGNWYRARIERRYGKYASLFFTDVGKFLEKISVRRLLAIENLCATIAYSPGVEVFFLERFHPHRFQIPDPEVLKTQTVRECMNKIVWIERRSGRGNGEQSETTGVSEFPLIYALESASGENFADRLEPLLRGKYIQERPPTCLLSVVDLGPTEEVTVVRKDGSCLEVQLGRLPAEELARLECELSALEADQLLENVDVLLGNDLVAVLWNEKTVRGKVIEFGPSTAEVRLVDYGILVNREISNLWKLPDDLADRLPPYGLRVEARNGAPDLGCENSVVVLCDIKRDEGTDFVTADVFPVVDSPASTAEVRVDGETSVSVEAGCHESIEKLDMSAGETVTERGTVDPVFVDSPSSFEVPEIEPSPCDFETISVDPAIAPVDASHLGTADETDGAAVKENDDLELSNEFGVLSHLVDIPPEDDVTPSAVDSYELIEATSESDQTPCDENYSVTQRAPDPRLEMNGAVNGFEETHSVPVNGRIARRSNRLSESEGWVSKDVRGSERCFSERYQDTRREQSSPTSKWQSSHGGPSPDFATSGRERRSTHSKPRNPRPHAQQDSTEISGHHQLAPHSQPRSRANSRGTRGSSVDVPRIEANLPGRQVNGLPPQIERKTEASWGHENKPESAQPAVEPNQAALEYREPNQDPVIISKDFLVEYIIGDKGVVLGVDLVRRNSIHSVLSQLSPDSLEEIPLRRLKIDQLVLMEHMCGLTRGIVVEITRHKIELKQTDRHGGCSATKVFVCPDVITDPRTTMVEIQLQSPRHPLRCGDLIRVNQGRYTIDGRLVAQSYECLQRAE